MLSFGRMCLLKLNRYCLDRRWYDETNTFLREGNYEKLRKQCQKIFGL